MRIRILITLVVCFMSSVVLASDQDLIVVDENGVGWAIDDNGNRIPFNLDDIEVLGIRPPPKKPGFCINSENFTLWWGGEGWHVCWDDEWETIDTPTLSVLLGGKLTIGEFISSDVNHTVKAVMDQVERVEQWSAIDQNKVSGSLDFNPKTAKEPKIIFKPSDIDEERGRGKPLSWKVQAKLGPLTATSSVFTQDNLHELRQEYEDLDKNTTPSKTKFDQNSPSYSKLLDKPRDVHSEHKHWILKTVNAKALALDNVYASPFKFTSGYRCPVKNKVLQGAEESQHIYGLALDFKAEHSVDSIRSRMVWEIYQAGRGLTPSPGGHFLYDENGDMIPSSKKPYGKPPNYPNGVNGYTKGHLDWR